MQSEVLRADPRQFQQTHRQRRCIGQVLIPINSILAALKDDEERAAADTTIETARIDTMLFYNEMRVNWAFLRLSGAWGMASRSSSHVWRTLLLLLRQANGKNVTGRPVNDDVLGRLDEESEPMPLPASDHDEIYLFVHSNADDLTLDVAHGEAAICLRHAEFPGEPADVLFRGVDQLGLRRHQVWNDGVRWNRCRGGNRLHYANNLQLRVKCLRKRSRAVPDLKRLRGQVDGQQNMLIDSHTFTSNSCAPCPTDQAS